MKLYFEIGMVEIRTNGEEGDEFTSYEGFNREEAFQSYLNEELDYEKLTKYDQKRYRVFGKVWKLPEDINTTDKDEIVNAICDCIGYDDVEDYIYSYRIRQARLKKGMSQREFADRIGMPLRTLENWEAGIRQPSPWVARLILKEIDSFGNDV